MITFNNVTKHYDDGSVVVDGLNLSAPSGKITVLVGPSGCGKTTSLRMINRLVEPSSGTILLNGESTTQMDVVQLRRRIGYVIQNAGLFPHKNIIDNIATTAILNGATKSKARNRAAELLEVVGLAPQLAKRYPWQLSGGQQQRVGVARALAAGPEFMLMDEPFSAVDPVVREQLQEEFLRIQKEVSKTIIMVTHDIDEAMKLGDLVAVLKPGGKLVQQAAPGTLLNAPHNAFVADFIGRDRGYRKLSFHTSGSLAALQLEPTIEMGASMAQARRIATQRWLLVTQQGKAYGWFDTQQHIDVITPDNINLAATFYPQNGTLRQLLDSALSSPCHRAVVIDAQHIPMGVMTLDSVLDACKSMAQEAI
ncbi:ATP-binding cassette domain-containing protein [Pectobacterium polaris]|uniref:ABC transporter ATP-binding protein n=1 Tax=Pectobacterium polaris TaxID=2042057 RepID=UPI001CC341D5|nr:ATP-binding cassette domain-containing protein [Pectobacterium polaris]UAY93294.1 ATP-binding cassette domain-containing protein [Pectobacterium polaris]